LQLLDRCASTHILGTGGLRELLETVGFESVVRHDRLLTAAGRVELSSTTKV
jgi:hypothetical protein